MIRFLVLFFTFNLFAATYEINKDHSHISYKIPYMSFSESEGYFSEYIGLLDFDPSKVELKSIEAKIDAASINTLDKKRDAHLRGADFFDVVKFPHVIFLSSSINKTGANTFDVNGTLEIRGKKKLVTLKTDFKGRKLDHTGKESVFFKALTKINRKDFGMLWNKSLDKTDYLIGDEITIELIIQAQPMGRRTAFSTHMIPSTVALENYAKFKRGEGKKPEYNEPEIKREGNHAVGAGGFLAEPAQPKAEAPFPWWEMVVGFIGFCLLIGVSYFLKLKIIKVFKISNYSESGWHALIGDAIIIGLTFIYSIWFFKVLYP